jgi:hypothetical protein
MPETLNCIIQNASPWGGGRRSAHSAGPFGDKGGENKRVERKTRQKKATIRKINSVEFGIQKLTCGEVCCSLGGFWLSRGSLFNVFGSFGQRWGGWGGL